MKVAIYIEQGVTQLVLTPESEWQRVEDNADFAAFLDPSGVLRRPSL